MGEPLAALPPDGVDPPVAAADELELLEPQAVRASAKNTAPIKTPTRIRRLGAAKLHFISIVPLRTSLGFAGLMDVLVPRARRRMVYRSPYSVNEPKSRVPRRPVVAGAGGLSGLGGE
jgi:hypothetical protein